ncbi:protein-disulfide reductase DsbD [Rodentibacter pneumotropicus]|uniref:Thiol:disulfide interchange protein DsbD n=1 Tax=Rodentibacter pneumotropicus TaxID=758 RepID=A0A4S2PPZ3_9PAST|nr:protein-disulfide reductase DsbD [Rodentibacter pneumotropicus]THA00700.1 protein-disulfide reductase DsbD [Rodentibacter pneumotropicus]THA01872.1 protein-disulfide reductase DsbD [Rodentibacter pneumotropicus]THA05277.1 protein-disulfide reductase DsbD [Rodentibacter pneumotropicus]THA17172.1 protein-disulfide reductase DsbD [Rodentibacter pneumotropicus]
MKKYVLLFALIFTVFASQAGLFDNKSSFLNVDNAFPLSAQISQDKKQLSIRWDIAEGYYLYQDKISAKVSSDPQSLSMNFNQDAEIHEDPYFGRVAVFTKPLVAYFSGETFGDNQNIEISYQGCTEGFCYPPEVKTLNVGDLPIASAEEKTPQNSTALLAEQDRLAAGLFQSKYAAFGFFLLGLGLAFTPCVLPMLPLLSSIVIGQQQRPNMMRAFSLSFLYVQGMALTYTLLGLAVAAIGLPFQIALQHPYVMIAFSVLFILLALSMFGVFTLQLPSSLQTKLNTLSQKQTSGAFGGAFLMGMIAGLVASPCTSAPLSGALLYVAQSGDLVTGAITLYLLALGMGIPLMLITLFGNKILPKSGEWMNTVKQSFGFVMLALPVFLISRILPDAWEPRLWALLATSFFVWFALQMPKNGMGYGVKVLSFVCAMVVVQPLQNLMWQHQSGMQSSAVNNTGISHIKFQRIQNLQELDEALAKNPHNIALLDLYADWCVACKEFERYTFSDKRVQNTFENILVLQVDMTKNSAENKAIMERYQVLGLPTILFFDASGNEISGSRITGFMDAKRFLNWINKIEN